MTVIVVTNCPLALRGDLTKWLIEINSGVYVGKINARVREELWERICAHIRTGQATMVYHADNEQNLSFRVWNTVWQPRDFDGITLMLHPSADTVRKSETPILPPGFSNAAKFEKLRQIEQARLRKANRTSYCVVSIETTGHSFIFDRLIEIAALRISGEDIKDFQTFVCCKCPIPQHVQDLTGITEEDLALYGKDEKAALTELISFINDFPIVCHNEEFTIGFLKKLLKKNNIPDLENEIIDIVSLTKAEFADLPNYHLQTIAEFLKIDTFGSFRALNDCMMIKAVYNKLNENS